MRPASPRSFATIAALAAVAVLSASCGASGGTAAGSETPAPAGEPEVTKAQLDALTTRVLQLEVDVANLKAQVNPAGDDPIKPPAEDSSDGEAGSGSGTATCDTGSEQSPIELGPVDALAADVANPVIGPMPASTATVDATAPDLRLIVSGGQTLELEGVTYTLQSIDIHSPSEHTIKGAQAPLELQLVHTDASGHIAVLSVMMTDGVESAAIQPLVDLLDGVETATFDPSSLLPATMTSYRYLGSLTSAPCTEGVSWVVLDTPVTASAAQIEAIAAHVPADSTRPTQPRGDRVVGLDITP